MSPCIRRLVAVAVFAVSACGGGSSGGTGTTPPPPPPPVASVGVALDNPSVEAGGAAQATATLRDANNALLTGRAVAWSSSDQGIASIGSGGSIAALAPGSVTITATSETRNGVAQLTVTIPAVGTVTATAPPGSLEIGATVQASAIVRDNRGATLSGRGVTWSSPTPGIATVGASGVITGVAAGNAVIQASSEGKTGAVAITVVVAPVATVVVAVTSPLTIGATTQAAATLRDTRGAILLGRNLSWNSSNPSVAAIDALGRVTAVGIGVTTITATSEGRTGTVPLTVTQPAVTSVAIFGTARIKVGDSYNYTAEARLADGTLVQRPVTWSVVEPGRALITTGGVLTPLVTGPITVRATVEAVSFNGALTGYDWILASNVGVIGAFLAADTPITNKFGTSEYPTLGIGCSTGTFLIFVDTENFITQNGLVAFNFDAGTIFSQTWIEFDLISGLVHPGPTNFATKNLALTIAASRTFSFAFTEFQSVARATTFRVTGLTPLLNQILNACPSNTIMAEPDGSIPMDRLRPFLAPSPMSPERAVRQQQGAANSPSPAGALQGIQVPAPMRVPRP